MLTGTDCELRLGRDVGGLLVALHAAAEDPIDPVRLREDGRIANAKADPEADPQHWKVAKQEINLKKAQPLC